MPKHVPASLAVLSLLILGPMSAAAQEIFRSEPPPPLTGPGGAAGGGLGTNQGSVDLHGTLSPPTPAPQVSPQFEPPRAAPPVAASETNRSAPEANPPLFSAHSSGDGSGGECDITEAARQNCSGAGCLLSCSPDACAGQESDKCEFVIDCTAEIASEALSGEQQCDDQNVEYATIEKNGQTTPVAIVRIPVGQTCKPPPCMK